MKLPLLLLRNIIELPVTKLSEVRHIFDDLGLEVKDVEERGGNYVLNIETLANRGDHLSALGIAREISARFLTEIKAPLMQEKLPKNPASRQIKIETALCTAYAGLELTVAKRELSLPSEIKEALGEAAGNHWLVDLLNYVTIELGQPMHAFDQEKLEGGISVVESEKDEKVIGLDRKEYLVPKGSILIRDEKKIIAVAGIIGCENSMIDGNTTDVIIESASFDPVAVRKTKKAMGILTEASYIFERGSDPEAPLPALKRVAHLAGAGVDLKGLTFVEGSKRSVPIVNANTEKIRTQLNLTNLKDDEIIDRLNRLGFKVEANKSSLSITVPSWRIWDVSNENDIIEEVSRVISLNKVKPLLPPLSYEEAPLEPLERLLVHIEPSLIGNGFIEVISKGFYSQRDASLIGELDPKLASKHITLKNAVDSDYSHMKVSNLIHLARIAAQNQRRGVLSVKIYESCRLFSSEENQGPYSFERDVLSFAASGRWKEHEWRKPESRESMAGHFKGALESLIRSTGNALEVGPSDVAILHPGYQGSIVIAGEVCGFFGLAHPLIAERLELRGELFYCEIDAHKLAARIRMNQYREASEFPAVKRDLTLKLPLQTQAGEVVNLIKDLAPGNMEEVVIHDDFLKQGEDFRRVTFRITFQNLSRTLESKEVDKAIEAILAHLARKNLEMA